MEHETKGAPKESPYVMGEYDPLQTDKDQWIAEHKAEYLEKKAEAVKALEKVERESPYEIKDSYDQPDNEEWRSVHKAHEEAFPDHDIATKKYYEWIGGEGIHARVVPKPIQPKKTCE